MSDARREPVVIFVTPWYPEPRSPASGVFVREHAIAAARFGDVAVVHLAGHDRGQSPNGELEELPDEPLPTVRAGYRHGRPGGVLRQIGALHRALSFLRRTRGIGTGLIHAHTAGAVFPAALYARLTRVPLVVTEHWSVYLEEDPARLPYHAAALTRWSLHQAQAVLPVGSSLARAMRRLAPRARYRVVPNVVDGALFFPADDPPAQPQARLMAVGLLSPEKRYDTLLEAVQILAGEGLPVQLEIAGYGPEERRIASLIGSLGLERHVRMLGYLPKPALAERLRSAHLFVHASAFETFGVSVAEALASGVPVVCTRCGGPEDYVTPQMGRLVARNDARALAHGIRDAIASLDSFDRRLIAEQARERFSAEAVGRQLHAVYEEIRRG